MDNSICPKCGVKGYNPLFGPFECLNQNCSESKTITVPILPPLRFTAPSNNVVVGPPTHLVPQIMPVASYKADDITQYFSMKSPPSIYMGTTEISDVFADISLLEGFGYFNFICVAGGAPRNWFYGHPANDIDVFVLNLNEKLFIYNTNFVCKNPTSKKYPDDFFVYEGVINNRKYQIITNPIWKSAADIKTHIDKFDFGLNQIVCANVKEFCYGFAFINDFNNNTLTANFSLLDETNIKRLPERYAKMKQYFPNHRLEII